MHIVCDLSTWFKPSVFKRIFRDALSTFVIGGNASIFSLCRCIMGLFINTCAIVSSFVKLPFYLRLVGGIVSKRK